MLTLENIDKLVGGTFDDWMITEVLDDVYNTLDDNLNEVQLQTKHYSITFRYRDATNSDIQHLGIFLLSREPDEFKKSLGKKWYRYSMWLNGECLNPYIYPRPDVGMICELGLEDRDSNLQSIVDEFWIKLGRDVWQIGNNTFIFGNDFNKFNNANNRKL